MHLCKVHCAIFSIVFMPDVVEIREHLLEGTEMEIPDAISVGMGKHEEKCRLCVGMQAKRHNLDSDPFHVQTPTLPSGTVKW